MRALCPQCAEDAANAFLTSGQPPGWNIADGREIAELRGVETADVGQLVFTTEARQEQAVTRAQRPGSKKQDYLQRNVACCS